MKPGPLIRRMFGPFEHQLSELYRSMYIDIDALVQTIVKWHPSATNILEVGCGEGQVTERLSVAYPDAKITAIDITSRVGRLYRGSRDRVRFRNCDVQNLAVAEPGCYDLVVMSDVLHHVPPQYRQSLIAGIRTTLTVDGSFVFKDWEKNWSLIHGLCYASDRWLTGDSIEFMTRQEMKSMLVESFGENALIAESRVRPRWNNIATLVRLPKMHSN